MKLLDIISESREQKTKNAKLVYNALKSGKSTYQVRNNDMDLVTYVFEYKLSDVCYVNYVHTDNLITISPIYNEIIGGRIPGQQTHIFDKLAQKFRKFNIVLGVYPPSITYTSDEERKPDDIIHQN